jgi:hypothetical protein
MQIASNSSSYESHVRVIYANAISGRYFARGSTIRPPFAKYTTQNSGDSLDSFVDYCHCGPSCARWLPIVCKRRHHHGCLGSDTRLHGRRLHDVRRRSSGYSRSFDAGMTSFSRLPKRVAPAILLHCSLLRQAVPSWVHSSPVCGYSNMAPVFLPESPTRSTAVGQAVSLQLDAYDPEGSR